MSARKITQDEIDEEMIGDDELSDGDVAEEECGRWSNGSLSRQCSKAGSEECDWLCPIGLARHRPKKRAGPLLKIMEGDE